MPSEGEAELNLESSEKGSVRGDWLRCGAVHWPVCLPAYGKPCNGTTNAYDMNTR